jgi:hypothetical protein
VKNGVPFDVAVSWEAHERLAWGVTFGELDGGSFDWSAMRWRERK